MFTVIRTTPYGKMWDFFFTFEDAYAHRTSTWGGSWLIRHNKVIIAQSK